jgi:hypothetical protein
MATSYEWDVNMAGQITVTRTTNNNRRLKVKNRNIRGIK